MHDIIDLERYPLDRLDSEEGRVLVQRCRDDLSRDGLFNLEELIRSELLRQIVSEVKPLFETSAFTHRRAHNIYFLPDVEGIKPEHPVLQQFETVNHTVCADQIPKSPLVRLYEWRPFAQFLAAVMGKSMLYPMDDELACLNVMAYRHGEALNWHFDRCEFTTTLLLQAADQGGDFQYKTGLRDDNDPNYDGIGAFLEGDQSDATTLKLGAGTLNIFRGKNTLHRVTPVLGGRERIITVFSYYEEPGVHFSDEESLGFYGRTHA